MSIAQDLHALTLSVLDEECTAIQADTYRRVHGITSDGYAPTETVSEVAESRGTSKPTILMQLATAESRVYRALCSHLLARVEDATPTTTEHQARQGVTYITHVELGLAAVIQEATGTHTLGREEIKHTNHLGYQIRHPYGQGHSATRWVQLGEGSERMVSIAKRREDQGRTSALEQAHRTYSDHRENG